MKLGMGEVIGGKSWAIQSFEERQPFSNPKSTWSYYKSYLYINLICILFNTKKIHPGAKETIYPL